MNCCEHQVCIIIFMLQTLQCTMERRVYYQGTPRQLVYLRLFAYLLIADVLLVLIRSVVRSRVTVI